MVGRTIGKYQITEKIGQGGGGQVYKAVDLTLDRPVALKFLAPDLSASDDHIRRFEREARAISSLHHPNIAVLYEAQQIDGERFIAFEYLDGGTLREHIAEARRAKTFLPLSRVLRYATQMCSAMAYAHGHGVIHRDMKSSNVMLAGADWIKVTDFGLAKLRGTEDVTRTGAVLGTAPYMSPEQASARSLDHRSDLFSLGVVIFELATGELPFDGPSADDYRINIVTKAPRKLRDLRPDAPEALEQIVGRLLEKKPDRRYQSASEVQSDLESLERGQATQQPLGSTISLSGTLLHRRVLPALLFAVLAAFAVLIGWWGWKAYRALPVEKSLAVLRFENIGGDAAAEVFCDGLMEALASKLTLLEQFQGTLSVVPASDVRREGVRSVSAAQRAFNVNLVVTGSLQRTPDGLLLLTNVVDARTVRQLRSNQVLLARSALPAMQEEVVAQIAAMLELEVRPEARELLAEGRTSDVQAYDFYLQGRGYLQAGASGAEQAITVLEHALRLDPKYALAHAALAEAFWRKYQATREPSWVERAWQSANVAKSLNPRLAPVHTTLAMLYSATGKYEDAIRESDAALRIDGFNRDAFAEKAAALDALGRLPEAEALLKRTIGLRPGYWNAHLQLGRFYLRYGRYAEAEAPFKRAVELVPDNASGYINLGATYHLQGRLADAERMFKRAIEIKPTPDAYSNLATIYFFQGRYADAVPIYEKLTAGGTANYLIWGNLGDAYRWTPGNERKAVITYRRAIQLAEQQLQINPRDAETLGNVATYYAKVGDAGSAVKAAERAAAEAPEDKSIAFALAIAYEVLGQRDKALEFLRRAVDGGYSMNEIAAEPELRKLREDPRFRM